MNVPIIFCHYGKSDYLLYTLQAARYYNPSKDIILLGDSENLSIAIKANVRHENLCDYENHYLIREFEINYFHFAGENHGREFWLKFNFKRYYYILSFLEHHSCLSFWYFDSDVILLTDLTVTENIFKDYDFAVQTNINGLVNSLFRFKEYLIYNFTLFSDNYFLNLQKDKINKNNYLALTEMATFDYYVKKHNVNVIKLNSIINGKTFDECILLEDGMQSDFNYIIGKKFKRLYFDIAGNIYCYNLHKHMYIKMNALNMSGSPTIFYRNVFFSSLLSNKISFIPGINFLHFNFGLSRYSLIRRIINKILSFLFLK